ncbi:MAG: VOC family protein [Longimicrobiales bacterium]
MQIILLGVALLVLIAVNTGQAQTPPSDILARVDHLVYGAPNLERGIAEIEKLIGVRASFGGQHPGRGTHNALIALGPTVYLEIIARDPQQSVEPQVFGIGSLESSRLVSWAANGSDLDALYQTASGNGIPVGAVGSGSRQRPDGVLLSWRYTDPAVAGTDGVIPFFIDWGSSAHPARTAAPGARLVELRAEHPQAPVFQRQLQQLGLNLRVDTGPRPAIIAIIEGPRGRVELR